MGGMSKHIAEATREIVALMADGQVRTTREIANTLGRAKSQVDGVIRRYLTLGKRRVQTVNGTEVQYWMLSYLVVAMDARLVKHLERMAELDAEGIQCLFEAAADYHQKHCKGRAGAAAICLCGAGVGQSKACRGLFVLRDFFRSADLDSEEWRGRFHQIQRMMM